MATKKLKDETAKSIEDAEQAAKDTGTGNPVLNPELSNMPEPGTTGDLDVVTTDEATSLNPNVTLSGTKPDGKGGQVLLDTVDPSVANAALLKDTPRPDPVSPADAPEDSAGTPGDGEVLFRCTADNGVFYTGGKMAAGCSYVMSRSEADTLVKLKAGRIETGNAKTEGSNA